MKGDRTLSYKGYCGSLEVDLESGMLFGKIEFINDLVTYTAENVKGLEKEFRAAVDDYLETCKEVGKESEKPLSGTFNVRIGPERHKKIALSAMRNGTTINDECKKALDLYLSQPRQQVHIHYHEARRENLVFGEETPYQVIKETRIPKH